MLIEGVRSLLCIGAKGLHLHPRRVLPRPGDFEAESRRRTRPGISAGTSWERIRLRRLRDRGAGGMRPVRKALIESLEASGRKRGSSALPAVAACIMHHAVNNVETLCKRAAHRVNGPSGFWASAPKRTGPQAVLRQRAREEARRLRSVDETTLRERDYDYAGGMLDDRPLKALIPGVFVGPVPAARPARYAGQLRPHPEGRVSTRLRRTYRAE